MFTKPIYSTTLTGDTADRLFSKITAGGNTIDQTFLTTMRILLHKRVQDLPVQLTCKTLQFSLSQIEDVSATQAMKWFIPQLYTFPANHEIVIISTSFQNTGAKMLELVRANCGNGKRFLSNYALLEDLRIFYVRKLNALFYYSETDKKTVIFTDNLEPKHFHALQTMLPKYVPSLFADAPLTESETALLKSCSNKTATEYERLVAEFVKDLDIRGEIIRSQLTGFETAYERQKLEELKDQILLRESDYENHLITLRKLTREIEDKKFMLAGLECAIEEHADDSELMEYFMCNKNLTIIDVNGTAIEFVVHGYVDIFDAEAFASCVKNTKSYLYSKLSPLVTKPQMKSLYKAIFGDSPQYKLRICAAYSADIKTGLKALDHYTFPPESTTYLPNPHIQNHGCIGSYATKFHEYMRNHDYVGAIDQAVVSARNLNFHDSVVISNFVSQLSHNTSVTCIEKSDGTLLTTHEAIKELEGGADECQDQS
jgi:hypothetical protein